MRFRQNSNVDADEAFKNWVHIYNLYHNGEEYRAGELAIKQMEKIVGKYVADARAMVRSAHSYNLMDPEDLEQSLNTIILMHLPFYEPYNKETGVPCLGSTFLVWWLKEGFSDYSRGGDGLGNGAVPKYYEKKNNGKPHHASYEEEIENGSGSMFRMSSPSAESLYFEKVAEKQVSNMERFLNRYSTTAEREKARRLYLNSIGAYLGTKGDCAV